MKAGKFARQRAIIEYASHRSASWRKRAMARLIAYTHTEPMTTGKRVIAYKLANGKVVCVKHRYQTEQIAIDHIDHIGQIARETDGRTKPIRAYPCYWCMGWHITSHGK